MGFQPTSYPPDHDHETQPDMPELSEYGRVTYSRSVILTGRLEFLRDPDGRITHVSVLTRDRDEPTLIPFGEATIEPIPRSFSEVPKGRGGA